VLCKEAAILISSPEVDFHFFYLIPFERVNFHVSKFPAIGCGAFIVDIYVVAGFDNFLNYMSGDVLIAGPAPLEVCLFIDSIVVWACKGEVVSEYSFE
jgi:hypothetical protein